MLFPFPLPAAAAIPLAGAVDALRLADEALGVALESLAAIELEDQRGLDTFDVTGIQANVRLYLALFAGVADGSRFPLCTMKVRELVNGHVDDARNVPGFEKAAMALLYVTANLDDVMEALDECDQGGDWYGAVVAANHAFEVLRVSICSSIVGRPPRDSLFGSN